MIKTVIKKYWFLLILGFVFTVGAFLRLYMLSRQILLDDEWHGINFVIGKTFLDVLTEFDPADNSSPPLNLYRLFLYHSFGWSEFTLRLPAILAGLLSLIFLPLLVKQIFNERVALLFASLLAISPFLIFYSRFSRAYGLVMLLCFWTLLLFYQWLTAAKHRYAICLILTGSLAVYAHLFSLVAVSVPFAVAFGIALYKLSTKSPSVHLPITVSFKNLLTAAFILSALLLLLQWPALVQSCQLPWAEGKLSLDSFITAAILVSGTANIPLTAIFFVLCLAGHVLLIKQKPLLGCTFLAVICAYLLVLLVTRPRGIDTAVVLLRYMIVVVPIVLTMVALAVDCLCSGMQKLLSTSGIHRIVPFLVITGLIVFLFVTGPLPRTYVTPNSFTNHSAFQGSYEPQVWERSDARHVYHDFSVKHDQIPRFYHWLNEQPDVQAIIEYPFDICNYNNLFYYYQHFHKKDTMVGYCSDPTILGYAYAAGPKSPASKSFTVGILNCDQILSRVTDPKKLGFHNMVDMTDSTAISRSQADIIVLHKFVMALKIMPGGTDSLPVYYRSVPHFDIQFRQAFGPPVYEDAQITCFRIK